MTSNGYFLTLEGIEGAGKSTLIDYIANQARLAGKQVVTTREPGGTSIGEQIRSILLNTENASLSDNTELLLMFAARAQHIDEIIQPALNAGKLVICDRFTDASFAYQGGGRGIDEKRIQVLEDWTQQGLQPDLTLLFDLDVEIGLRRAGNRSQADRFEQEKVDFFERVRQCYLNRAERYSDRYQIIHSARPLDDVKQQLNSILSNKGLC